MIPSLPDPIPGSFDYAVLNESGCPTSSGELGDEEEEEEENDDIVLNPSNLQFLVHRIEHASSAVEQYNALQELYAQLSSSEEKGLARASAIDQRVDRALCQQVIRQTGLLPGAVDTPSLSLTLDSLEILWTKQSTTQRRKESRLRGLEIVPYLVTLWKAFVEDPRIALPIISIFRAWAKLQDVQIKSLLIKAGLVKAMHSIFVYENSTCLLWPNGVGLMKDLIFRAESTEKQYMFHEWLNHVLRAVKVEACVEAVTACLWNWAVDEDLAVRMARHGKLWAALGTILSINTNQTTVGAQRNALSTMGIIVSICTSRFESHCVPQPLATNATWTIDFLFETLKEAQDGDLRRRAVRTIRCLSTCSWGRDMLYRHFGDANGLMQRLTRLLLNPEEQDDTRIQVSLAMKNLLPHLNEGWSQMGPHTERSIVKAIEDETSNDKIVLHAMQLLSTCFEHSPWKRGSACLSASFFERLKVVLQEHPSDANFHDNVAILVWQSLNKMSKDAGDPLVVAFPVLIDVFALLLSTSNPEFETCRGKTIECITKAVENDEAKKQVVRHDILLNNLVNVCVISTGERKASAKALLVLLVTEL